MFVNFVVDIGFVFLVISLSSSLRLKGFSVLLQSHFKYLIQQCLSVVKSATLHQVVSQVAVFLLLVHFFLELLDEGLVPDHLIE